MWGDKLKSKMPTKRRSRAIEAGDGTLTDRAYRELEEMIVTLQLSPGTVLSEQALAVRLKIGRTPIREALQRLARDGLVVIMLDLPCHPKVLDYFYPVLT